MPLDKARAREHLRHFRFDKLFIEEMGWDRHHSTLDVEVDETVYTLNALAEKRGLVAYRCEPDPQGHIPLYNIRRKIERRVAKTAYEHLIVYVEGEHTEQVWQWVKRELGRPAACREQRYHIAQTGEALVQKLQHLVVDLEEEEDLILTMVTGKVKKAFDLDKVTKRFYDLFKREHDSFLKFIQGIPDADLQAWYTSVMLNRLMFIYFIQKKGFLDSDQDYLRHKLSQTQQQQKDYYRDFLCPLFFEGFAKKEQDRSADMNKLLGQVPYLNGGIFTRHYLEELHGQAIAIPDAAFANIFDFFDAYYWHLDERPLKRDDEINPDVLGYIFEKYINQKQMGAYYTKEDITEYISKNTIIPFLFDAAEKRCAIAFKPESAVWRLLTEDPDRYIYDAVKHGLTVNVHTQPSTPLANPLELPEEIAVGINDVKQHTHWNKTAQPEYGLPTEIWREVVARRQRYAEVRAKLAAGEITTINDLITYNLNIRQFAADVIENCEGPELLRAIFYTIAGRQPEKSHEHPWPALSVLDPTCGSGAFLFAALNILEPLYEACLQRMEVFVQEMDQSEKAPHPEKFRDFRSILGRIEEHPNRRYFILKSIIVNNLFGVDIMPEAVEICKLRLFLKLVAQVEQAEKIEALPDIDFNIRSGNTLVGFVHPEQVKQAISRETTGQGKLLFGESEDAYQAIAVKAADVDQYFESFRRAQLDGNGGAPPEHKQELTRRLDDLSAALDVLLAGEYNINIQNLPKKKEYDARFKAWQTSHQPFHWFAEFYGIMQRGGFDVIIGNPPYVEYTKVKKEYSLRGYKTEGCGNLYGFTTERSLILLNKFGSFGFIVPISIVCTQRMGTLQKEIQNFSSNLWLSNYAERPSKLFTGSEVLLTIIITRLNSSDKCSIYSTGFTKWSSEERETLFANMIFNNITKKPKTYVIPKIGNYIESRLISKVSAESLRLSNSLRNNSSNKIYYRIGGGRYWKIFTNFQPKFILNGKEAISSRENYLYFNSKLLRDAAISVLSSTLFYWFFILTTNCRDLNPSDLQEFPINLNNMADKHIEQLSELCNNLMIEYKDKSKMKEKNSSLTGHIVYQEFYPRLSKSIIDEIDRVLAQHYGFTDEELDFIINYDFKYRMGAETEE